MAEKGKGSPGTEGSSGKEAQGQAVDTGSKGFLRWIEVMGNKLPHPFWIFLWITIFIILLSALTAFLGVSAVHPDDGSIVEAKT